VTLDLSLLTLEINRISLKLILTAWLSILAYVEQLLPEQPNLNSNFVTTSRTPNSAATALY
jgi:hypothetical protein